MNTVSDMLEKLRALVESTYENVPLYRRLYGEMPELRDMDDFRRLPYLRRDDFALCAVVEHASSLLEDIVSDIDEAAIILPPLENKTAFPFPRLESAEDRDRRYEVFYFLLEQAGIVDETSFLIITDSGHSYYCGEIANNLLYYRHPTWMMLLRDHSDHEIRTWIDRFRPDHLLLGLNRIPHTVTGWGVSSIFTINQYDRDISCAGQPGISHFDIYAITEICWIGIRIPGGHYVYPGEYFLMESDPQDYILAITTLESRLQPFIRYRTPDRGRISGENTLQVTYIGEH